MSLTLIGRHAEDVGGGVTVEPGAELPDSADPKIVERLTRQGLVRDGDAKKPARKPAKPEGE